MKKILLIVLCLNLRGEVYSEPKYEKVEVVSLVQLIATPEKFHRKKVGVNGYLHYEFENSTIVYTKELSDNGSVQDALWVSYDDKLWMNPETDEGLKYFDKKWVLLVGRFDKNDKGHMGLNSGGITNVSRISTRE